MRGNHFANSWHQLGTDFLVWWLGGGVYEHWLLCGSQARGSQSEERGLLQTAGTAGELSSCVRVHLCSSPSWTTPSFDVVLASATPLNLCNLVQQLPQITQREMLQQVEREKKNLLISLVLVLTSYQHWHGLFVWVATPIVQENTVASPCTLGAGVTGTELWRCHCTYSGQCFESVMSVLTKYSFIVSQYEYVARNKHNNRSLSNYSVTWVTWDNNCGKKFCFFLENLPLLQTLLEPPLGER